MVQGSNSTIVSGQLKYNWSPLFWTYNVGIGTMLPSTIRGFGDVAGLQGVIPSFTNMQKANELSAPEEFTVMSMRMVFMNCDPRDLLNFQTYYTNRLIVNNVQELNAPCEYWPGGAGITTDSLNGIPDSRSILSLSNNPIYIGYGSNFRTEHVGSPFATVGAHFTFRVYLEGQYGQAVG